MSGGKQLKTVGLGLPRTRRKRAGFVGPTFGTAKPRRASGSGVWHPVEGPSASSAILESRFAASQARPQIAHADPGMAAAGSRNSKALIAAPIVELWGLDGVHFQPHGSHCRMWVPPRFTPRKAYRPTRKTRRLSSEPRACGTTACIIARAAGAIQRAHTLWSVLLSLRRVSEELARQILVML
jgi:hypothetical protein